MLDLRMIMISQQSIIFKQQQEIEYLKKQVAELQANIIIIEIKRWFHWKIQK